jgi:hypothetical protein
LTLKNRSVFAATVLLGVDDRRTVPQELLRKAREGGSGRGIPLMFEPKRFVVLDLSVTHCQLTQFEGPLTARRLKVYFGEIIDGGRNPDLITLITATGSE